MYDQVSLDMFPVFRWTKLPCITSMVILLIYPGLVRVHDHENSILVGTETADTLELDPSNRIWFLVTEFTVTRDSTSFTSNFCFNLPLSLILCLTLKFPPGIMPSPCSPLTFPLTTGPSPGKDLKKNRATRSKIYFYISSSFRASLQEPRVMPSSFTSLLYTVPVV